METIQMEVTAELAQRLRIHPYELPQILEWGLRCVEVEGRPGAETGIEERQKLLNALRSTGLLCALDPALAARYRAGAKQPRQTPVYVKGKPLSEMIVAERGPEWADEA